MVYRNRDELLRAYMDWIDKQPGEVDKSTPGLSDWTNLFEVYIEALTNPPEGVIGVGVITYAEQKLQEAQQ